MAKRSRTPRIVITTWRGLVDSVISDIPVNADVLVVDRDPERTSFEEFQIEPILKKSLKSAPAPRSFGMQKGPISRETRREYIRTGGNLCINCGSGNISAGRFDSEGREAWQPVQCYDCGSEWNDIFRLIGVDDVVLPEEEPIVHGVLADEDSPEEVETSRPAFPMECEVPVFKGCGKLLASAKQVVSNWEQGDLAAAVRNLDSSIKEIEGKVTERPPDVILLVIEFCNGRNFFACEDSDRAIDELYEFVEEYWNELPSDVGPIPFEKLKAIEIYFHEKDGEESYEMEVLPLLSSKVEG